MDITVKASDYVLIQMYDPKLLEIAVKEHLSRGWVLLGAPIVGENSRITQAMVRPA